VPRSDRFESPKPTFPVPQISVNSDCDRKAASISHCVHPHYPKERQATAMKNKLPEPPMAALPHPQTNPSSDQRFTIAFWMMKYETLLFHTAPYSTYERYTRALDKLFATFPEKRFLHEFRRADLEDYKKQRLESGTSPETVNIELSILRSFWNFLLSAEADGVFFNPAKGVRVKQPKSGSSEGAHNDPIKSPA
jgi:hypothetical protein